MSALEAAPLEGFDPEPYIGCEDGRSTLHLMVDGVHCGGCVQRIERALMADPAVERARVNLTTRRLIVTWRGPADIASRLAGKVTALGHTVVPYDPEKLAGGDVAAEKQLLVAMGVAGFAAGNVMLFSISVWAGQFQGMGAATRDLLHWFTALVALPAIAFAGWPFFGSALAALRHGRTNMDVPIALAVLLAAAMSLSETIQGGAHVYFDSAIMLLFFLLVGRYLDRRARGVARSAAERLLALDSGSLTVLDPDGRARPVPHARLRAGMILLAAAGERIGADGRIAAGESEVDTSLISGETLPRQVGPGDPVFAGTLNLAVPLRIEVTAVGEGTLLAEIVRLMELAEQRRARYVVLADRVARLYAPVVHGLALATFLGWVLSMGAAWQVALLYAIAVLIITCPCAMGLAVPAVQVIASGRLLSRGVLLKSATALERMARIDTVVFDKTGTLTDGRPSLDGPVAVDALHLAASLAGASRHPLARALCRALPGVPVADAVEEVAGQGLRAGDVRLGSRRWCGIAEGEGAGPELWLTRPDAPAVRFAFRDQLRTDAAAVVAALRGRGLEIALLSGDRRPVVAGVAQALGIERWQAGCTPADKAARLEQLAAEGRRVLMVGDGLNDAPALAGAYVSLSPSTAADVSQTVADAVFQGERLQPLLELLRVAGRADRLIKQNFSLALAYNVITIPLAIAGLVTPLVAALCMSASSLVVVGNALRLRIGAGR